MSDETTQRDNCFRLMEAALTRSMTVFYEGDYAEDRAKIVRDQCYHIRQGLRLARDHRFDSLRFRVYRDGEHWCLEVSKK